MPVSEDRLYRPEKINLWFAVSSVLMTLSILWFIVVDYDRPWRQHQAGYFQGKAALAHLEYLDAIREEKSEALEESRARLADAQQYLETTAGTKLAALREELAEADFQFKRSNAPWSSAAQVLDVTRDSYEKALGQFGEKHPRTEAAHAQYRAEEENVERLRKEKEHWEDVKRQLEGQIKEIEAPMRTAEKAVRDLEELASAALQKDQQFRGVLTDQGLLGGLPVVSWIINAPLLDFTAPKNTPGRYQVNQLVLPDVRQQLNYLETYTTDRCTTCHVAIADPEFSRDRLAQRLERSLPGINEALQRMGQSGEELPTPPMVAGGQAPLPAGKVTEHWDELNRKQQDEYFEALLAQVNRYLKLSGRKTISLAQPLLAHPDLDLYVTTDSPHPMARVGCTVCHEGNPQETDFVFASHSPPTHAIQKEWEEKYYIRRLGVPNCTFETVQHYWDRPMLLPQYTEASCAKCHTEVADIHRFRGEPKGTNINLGRHLFTQVGCVNCHATDDIPDARRAGPDLSHIAAKLKPEFVESWAFFPQKFRPSTLMPHFFKQENTLPGSANQFDPAPELRTETEVAAIRRYLFAVSKDWAPIEKPADVVGDVERGRKLVREVGCLGCHANLAEFGEEWITRDIVHREGIDEETARYRYKGMTHVERSRYAMEHFPAENETFFEPDKHRFDPEGGYQPPTFSRVGPELSGVGSKATFEWLYAWVSDPAQFSPDTKMPNMRLSPGEAADIAAYLATLKHDAFAQESFAMNDDRRAMADSLMFDLLAAQRSERRSRAIMEDEGGDLSEMMRMLIAPSPNATAAEKQRAYDIVSSMSLEDKKLAFLGNKMISHYGCYACHTIPGFEEATPPGTNLTTWAQKPITQLDFAFYDHAFHHMRHEKEKEFGHLYPLDADELNYWSPGANPEEQITHTHAAFAKHKMLNPRIWDREKIKRPYDKLKMPNFYFTEHEAEALTTYLLSRVSPRVNDTLKVDYRGREGAIAAGRHLTRELNCVGCHQIEDNVPTIQQYFRRKASGRDVFDETNAPPLLWGQGAKVQHPWFHRFLQHVETLRPWLVVRMPSFQLTGEQATTLVEYFAALSQDDAKELKQYLDPLREHLELAKTSTSENGQKAAGGSDWFETESLKPSMTALRRWAVERKVMRQIELDPLRTPTERFREAHRRLVERAEFLRELYDVAYPFVEPPKPGMPDERFQLGERFLNDMGCLKCHVLGPMLPGPAKSTDDFVQVYRLDAVRGSGAEAVAVLNGVPYAVGAEIDGHRLVGAENIYYDSGDIETKAYIEGTNAQGETERILLQAASAPNLGLTYQRLRRGWVIDWMLEPQLIQPGTKMPQNFSGGQSPFAGDERYPGSGRDHIELLVDYLFDAGQRNARVPLPKLLAPAAGEDFDEDGPEEFED